MSELILIKNISTIEASAQYGRPQKQVKNEEKISRVFSIIYSVLCKKRLKYIMIRLTVTSASVPTPRSVVCAQFYRNKTSQVYILPPLLALLSV